MGNVQSDWIDGKVFTDAATGITVTVRVRKGYQPKYQTLVSWAGKDSSGNAIASHYIRPGIKLLNNGAVASVSKDGMLIGRLYDEAQLWIEEQIQKHLDFTMDYRLRKEEEAVRKASGVNDTPHTGKTEREADKNARHEHNLAARRAADAERTSKTKGRSS